MEQNIKLRKLMMKDLESYLELNKPEREHHKYNGPYFEQSTLNELEELVENYRNKFLNGEENVKAGKMIVNSDNDELIGAVNSYWKSKETLWMEIGVVIFNENYWGKGIGYDALKMWISEVFNENPKIVRLGLTTWSGNERMMKLSEKLGMKRVETSSKRWRRTFKDNGELGLMDSRKTSSGRPLKRELTDLEKIKRLEAQIEYLKIENEFLKKLDEIERGDA